MNVLSLPNLVTLSVKILMEVSSVPALVATFYKRIGEAVKILMNVQPNNTIASLFASTQLEDLRANVHLDSPSIIPLVLITMSVPQT